MAVAIGSEPTSPRTLTSLDLAPRVRRVLENLQQTAASELGRQLQVVLHETEVELGRLADRNRGNQLEGVQLDALRSLRQHASALIPGFNVELEAELAQLHAPRRSRRIEELPLPGQGLTLVDDSEMDESAVLQDIATRSDSRNSLALQLLGHRFGVLAGASAFDAEHLPIGPHALCHALRNTCESLALTLEARRQLYRQFDKVAMAHFPTLLDALNARLVGDGILPHLSFVPIRARPATPGLARATDASNAHSQPAIAVRTKPSPGAATVTAAKDGFGNLQDLLARRRMLLAKLRPGGSEDRVREALPREDVLGALRRMRVGTGKAGSPTDIRQTLLAQARQQQGRGVSLDDAESDGFELFGLFFGQLQRELRKGSVGEAMVQRLQLPLLQVALRDHRFFVDAAHPARKLLDAVSLAGARWLADDDLDAQWLGLLQRAMGTVLEDPDAADDTFVAANHALQGGLQAAARKHEMGERRHVDAARGRDKLELARLRAGDEIARLVAGRPLQRFHALLLEQAWSDVLALVLLRNGEGSDAWREARDATAAIIDASTGTAVRALDPALIRKLQDALSQVGYHPEDATAMARQLANGPAEDADLASRTELVVQLKARARLGEDKFGKARDALPPRSSAEQAAYEQLAAITKGRWIDVLDPAQDRLLRRRLAWVGPRTGQALLVNRRGLRVDGSDLDGLARGLAGGAVHLVDADRHPAELAWQATLDNLQRIAGSAGQVEGDHAA